MTDPSGVPPWIDLDVLMPDDVRQETGDVLRELRQHCDDILPIIHRAIALWQRSEALAMDTERSITRRVDIAAGNNLADIVHVLTGGEELFDLLSHLAYEAHPDEHQYDRLTQGR